MLSKYRIRIRIRKTVGSEINPSTLHTNKFNNINVNIM